MWTKELYQGYNTSGYEISSEWKLFIIIAKHENKSVQEHKNNRYVECKNLILSNLNIGELDCVEFNEQRTGLVFDANKGHGH